MGSREHQGPRVTGDLKAQPVRRVQWVPRVLQAPPGKLVHQVKRVYVGPKALQVQLVNPDRLVLEVNPVPRDPWGSQDSTEPGGSQACREKQEPWEHLVYKARREQRALQGYRDLMDSRDPRAHKDPRALKE